MEPTVTLITEANTCADNQIYNECLEHCHVALLRLEYSVRFYIYFLKCCVKTTAAGYLSGNTQNPKVNLYWLQLSFLFLEV